MNEVCALKADHSREELHNLHRGVCLRGLTVDNVEKELSDWDEEKGDEERHDLCEEDEGEGEAELLLVEGVADVDNVENDQHNHEDDEVEADQEGVVVDARHQVVNGQDAGQEIEDVVESLTSIPHHDDGKVEGKLHHLQIVDARFVQQADDGAFLSIACSLIQHHEQHVKH